jgi:phage gp36-like protein
MAYATIDDVFARFPVHTLVGTGTNEVTSIEVSSIYIQDAEATVNAFLGSKYVTPLVNDPLVTQITADLAIFNMLAERAGRVPQAIQTRHDRVMSYLEMLRTGSYHQTFSPVLDELDQRADQTWVDDEKDARVDDAC